MTTTTMIYMSEDAMDCNYGGASFNNISSRHFEILEDPPSPELFDSESENESESTNTTSTFQNSLKEPTVIPSPKKLSSEELILKADNYLLRRVNKFLAGVPPPPSYTICQRDCEDFLVNIKQNRQYFWADPFGQEATILLDSDLSISNTDSTTTCTQESKTTVLEETLLLSTQESVVSANGTQESEKSTFQDPLASSTQDSLITSTQEREGDSVRDFLASSSQEIGNISSFDIIESCSQEINATIPIQESSLNDTIPREETNVNNSDKFYSHNKTSLPNLSSTFDICEQSSVSFYENNDSTANLDIEISETRSSCITENMRNCSLSTSGNTDTLTDDTKTSDFNNGWKPTLYYSISVKEGALLSWPEAFKHKCHGIDYNRNKLLEEFDLLKMKLVEKFVGAETQTTCNSLFQKNLLLSPRKKQLLLRRSNGQSPGKRLSYLARRRKTFSSANLQCLTIAEKKPLISIKRTSTRKGKSPRKRVGKSPRSKDLKSKSPRGRTPKGKSPRIKNAGSSSKKKLVRRLTLDGPSPRKPLAEVSKRALFQSPSTHKPGPSKITNLPNRGPPKVKKALFSTPTKHEKDEPDEKLPESRKRKSDEELSNPKSKWAKSLSFDCPRILDNSVSGWSLSRRCTNPLPKSDSATTHRKCEMSDINKKKLLWAVSEALKGKGINSSHPEFRQFASNLARKIKTSMPELENKSIPKKPGTSTSERMLKLAKHYVPLIMECKTAV